MRLYLIVFFAVIFSALPLLSSRGQTSVPIILQAAAPTPAVVAKSAAAPEIDLKATLQLLQDMQATNAATIKGRKLRGFDELGAANELKSSASAANERTIPDVRRSTRGPESPRPLRRHRHEAAGKHCAARAGHSSRQ
jgi:hypothetical protein